MFKALNFSPFKNNVLDYVGEPLVTEDGKKVEIQQKMDGKFVVLADGKEVFSSKDNIQVSAFLNDNLPVMQTRSRPIKASVIERLDAIASELESESPALALALDRISDKLEVR
jgi:hypothetical protein